MAEERTKKYAIEFKLYDGTTRSVSIEVPLGEDGGYYIPSIENKNGETLIYFTPSSPDMPAMEPIPVLNLNEVIDMVLTQAKESGEFDGKDGKSAYQYALDGGYTGTEEEFAQKLASETSGGGTSVQTDWNQTDETAPDFLKNKPFGDMPAASLPETEVTAVVQNGMNVVPLDESLFSGEETRLVVGFDGIDYSCTAKDAMGFQAFGNIKYLGGDDTGEPFCVLVAIGLVAMLLVDDTEPHTVSIKRYVVNKIQPVYFDSFHKFYTIPGNYTTYLFNDSECSQKVTAEEFIAVAKTQNFQIISSVSGIEVFASTPLFFSKVIDQNNMYCYVDVFWSEDGGGSIERKRYYTAEYTPTT